MSAQLSDLQVETVWSEPPTHLDLPVGVVHTWLARLDTTLPDDVDPSSELTGHELERAAKFRFDRDRERYIVAHVTLRRLLGRYLDMALRSVPIVRLDGGKPALEGDAPLAFNMSHASDLGLFGFRREGAVGIDVERIRPNLEIRSIAERFFTTTESRQIENADDDTRLRHFFTTWVRKEAVLKAVGRGLAMPLSSIDVSPDEPAPPLVATVDDPRSVWQIIDLPPVTDYVSALATTEPLTQVRCFAVGAADTLRRLPAD